MSLTKRCTYGLVIVIVIVAWTITTKDIEYNSDKTKAYFTLSNGSCIENITTEKPCHSWIVLHGSSMYSKGTLAFFYALFLIFLFLGIAIVADIFMGAIEVITRYLNYPLIKSLVKRLNELFEQMMELQKLSKSKYGIQQLLT